MERYLRVDTMKFEILKEIKRKLQNKSG